SSRPAIRSLFGGSVRIRWSCTGFSLRALPNGLESSRLLVSPARRYGTAVARNRIKRQGREIYRAMKYRILPGYDIAFIFFSGEYTFQDRQNQIAQALAASGLLRQ